MAGLLRDGTLSAEKLSPVISYSSKIIEESPSVVKAKLLRLKDENKVNTERLLNYFIGVEVDEPLLDKLAQVYAINMFVWNPSHVGDIRKANLVMRPDNYSVIDWMDEYVSGDVQDLSLSSQSETDDEKRENRITFRIVSRLKAHLMVFKALKEVGYEVGSHEDMMDRYMDHLFDGMNNKDELKERTLAVMKATEPLVI
jgi:hypothetical protein